MGRLVALESGRVSEGLQGCSDERADEGKLDFENLGWGGGRKKRELKSEPARDSCGRMIASSVRAGDINKSRIRTV